MNKNYIVIIIKLNVDLYIIIGFLICILDVYFGFVLKIFYIKIKNVYILIWMVIWLVKVKVIY